MTTPVWSILLVALTGSLAAVAQVLLKIGTRSISSTLSSWAFNEHLLGGLALLRRRIHPNGERAQARECLDPLPCARHKLYLGSTPLHLFPERAVSSRPLDRRCPDHRRHWRDRPLAMGLTVAAFIDLRPIG